MDRKMLTKALFALNEKMSDYGIKGEIGLYGGAVMCLSLNAREGTHDIDAIFYPKMDILKLANLVGDELGLEDGWFNDSVKGFVSGNNDMLLFLELSNLSIFVASPEYMFAMKAVSCRLDNENELSDIRFLISYLRIESIGAAEEIIYKYYPRSRIQQKTVYMLMEEIGADNESGK